MEFKYKIITKNVSQEIIEKLREEMIKFETKINSKIPEIRVHLKEE